METKEALDHIREILELREQEGSQKYDKNGINRLLDIVEKQASDSLTLRESRYKTILEMDLEVFRSVFIYGQSALKTTILVNGGAAIAVMAFLARYIGVENQIANMQFFLSALLVFGFGVLLGAFTTGFTYLTQSFFAHSKDKLGLTFQVISIVLGISSLSTFGLGIWFSYQGFGSAFGT